MAAEKKNIEIDLTSYAPEVRRAVLDATPKILAEWGVAWEGFAKDAISELVYGAKQSPNYKRTGRLRASLTFATKHVQSVPEKWPGDDAEPDPKDGVQAKEVPDENTVVVGTNVEYAAYVEKGTSKMAPRPFVKPAIEKHVDEYRRIVEQYLT